MRDSLHSHYDIIPPNIRGMIDSWVVAYAIDSAQSSVAVDDRLLSLRELLDEAARFGAVCELSGSTFASVFIQSRQYRESLRLAIFMGFITKSSPSVYGCALLHSLPPHKAAVMSHSSSECGRLGYAVVFALTLVLLVGRSHPDIQAVCRWLVPESVKIYAAMMPECYARCLDEAYGAVATAIHAADIPDVHGHEAALSLCEDLHVQVELCSIE